MAPASRTVLLACVAVALSLAPQQQPGLRCSPLVAASAREEAKHAWRAKLAASAAEDAANRAWLARLDSRTWTEVVATVSAQVMSNGEESAAAKQSWLARLDAPTWAAVAAAVAEVAASVQLREPSERETREAKRAWLARLDAPSWILGAATLVEVAGSAAAMESLRKDCDVGDAAACAALSEELDAGRARLDALDAWGAVSTAVATVAVEVTLQTAAGMPADEIAKAAWLVSLDTAAWARPQSEALREMDLRNEGRP